MTIPTQPGVAFHDLDAERAVLGACLLRTDVLDAVARDLSPADFGAPRHADLFGAMLRLRRRGDAADALTTEAELRAAGVSWPEAGADMVGLIVNVPNPAAAPSYARQVLAASARRALHRVGTTLAAEAADPTVAPDVAADNAATALARVDSPALTRDPGDVEVSTFVAQDERHRAPVVVPDLLDADDRVLIVAPEGIGKSELLRQAAVTVAHGLDPFRFTSIPAVPTLLVDLENPAALLRSRLRWLTDQAGRIATGEREALTLWHRPGGIDLRSRVDRSAFEDVLRRRRPRLVVLGPVDKSYQRRGAESDESVASEVQAVLDDLRTRHGFALVLEHHAPHASNGVRDLRPSGSSLWLRWPEYGLKLTPAGRDHPPQVLQLGRWGGGRTDADWPDELHRGEVWPWEGHWTRHGRRAETLPPKPTDTPEAA